MNPGVLISDIGHFKKVFVEARIHQSLLKKGFMGLRGAGGNYNAIQILFLNYLGDRILGIGGAGEKIIGHIFHIRERGRVVSHSHHINHPSDIDAAVTDKDADTGPFQPLCSLPGNFLVLGPGVPRLTQENAC